VRNLKCLFVLGICSAFVCASDGWKPAAGPLFTRWAESVSPERAWPEYPRPQFRRSEWLNLNGLWDYAIVSRDSEQPKKWQGKILVPFCVESALSGVMARVEPEQAVWYHRTFRIPQAWAGKHVLLNFQAVDWEATVWVNGKKIGSHRGGYDPFTFDITDALKDGENSIVVRVWDPTDRGYQPRGKQVLKPRGIWYTAVTGIWQTVWLEPVAESYIRALRITPDVDKREVRIQVKAEGASPRTVFRARSGELIARRGKDRNELVISIPTPKLWSPDTPYLYNLTVTMLQGAREVDEVHSYFGMRKIEVCKDESGINRLCLNGKPVFMYGPLDQGWWPDGLYTAPSDVALRYDVLMMKRFAMNMVRKHVKVEPQRWYTWCDTMGLLVWQDMPSGSNKGAEGKRNFRRELHNVIESLVNHPSIIMWVPFNEGWGQHDTPEIVSLVKKWDATRLVDEASGWHDRKSGDVRDVHSYPGPAMPPLEERRAAVLGEFGGLGLPLKGHTWTSEKNWGYRKFKTRGELTEAYVRLLGKVRPLIAQGLCAAVYTQISDVETEVNGLMTYDRAVVKMDLDKMVEAAQRLYVPPPVIKTVVPTSRDKARIWRYTTQKPPEGWERPGFDDSNWRSGPGGFGTKGTPGAAVRTVWKTSDIWLRSTIDLPPIEGEVRLLIHHDEDAQVYLNGVLAAQLSGYTTGYVLEKIRPEARKALRAGRLLIAVHCRQTTGGQYIDVGLVQYCERR